MSGLTNFIMMFQLETEFLTNTDSKKTEFQLENELQNVLKTYEKIFFIDSLKKCFQYSRFFLLHFYETFL